MKTFHVKFLREFDVQISADSVAMAQHLAREVMKQFPPDTCKLLSVIAEDYVEAPEQPDPPTTRPFGRPNGGGSPGTPVVRTEILADQIAEAA